MQLFAVHNSREGEHFFITDGLQKTPVFLQIGSFYPKVIQAVYETFTPARIIIYEPTPITFRRLTKAHEELPFTLHNKAVIGNKTGSIPFHYYLARPQMSAAHPDLLAPGDLVRMKDWGDMPCFVPCISLEGVFKENALTYVDVLLMDCEGAEFDILDELMQKPHLKIGQINLEVHLGTPMQRERWKEVYERLKASYTLEQDLYLHEMDETPLFLFRRKA